MDLKEIQDKLNSMLTGTGRKLVFWYDDDGSYEENIHALLLLRDAKDDCVRPFVENIDSVNRLYNRPIEMVFDQENIYLGSA